MPTASGRRGYKIDRIVAADVNAATVTVGDIYFTDFRSYLIGSTNGSTYNTTSRIFIPLSTAGYKTLSFKFQIDVAHDQAITMNIISNDNATVFSTSTLGGIVGRFVVPVSIASYYGIGAPSVQTPTIAYGGNLNSSRYHDLAIEDMPYVVIDLVTGSAPTAGTFDNFVFVRRSL